MNRCANRLCTVSSSLAHTRTSAKSPPIPTPTTNLASSRGRHRCSAKPRYRGDQDGNRVEVVQPFAGTGAAVVAVRHSENPAGPVLTLEPAGFSVFLEWATGVG
ncbi:DUF397 domain-containing protein [Streptomyces sp. AK04-3B]|uniref:DUF397 domain-containing protein n=1 Tax=Streptomyces sp. AK04-3B TaxID=3028650 RepID=UPI0029A6A959|nr:DUF397 domain-containing protein [Streptomyces sp. AK04-3B]MDX3803816.1 DUF397 domain-containing protein [Streptomyces sp. AK04-3B]